MEGLPLNGGPETLPTPIAQDHPVVYGYGDGGFASNSHGGSSVPTKGRVDLLERAISSIRTEHDHHGAILRMCPLLATPVDEGCTTMKCHGCGNVLHDVRPPPLVEGERSWPLRGLKLCKTCPGHRLIVGDGPLDGFCPLKDEERQVVRGLLLCIRGNEDGLQNNRIRNRDKNASRNIYAALDAMITGAPRPLYLRPQPRRRRMPPIVAVDDELVVGNAPPN
jgi:hypothetical protein